MAPKMRMSPTTGIHPTAKAQMQLLHQLMSLTRTALVTEQTIVATKVKARRRLGRSKQKNLTLRS